VGYVSFEGQGLGGVVSGTTELYDIDLQKWRRFKDSCVRHVCSRTCICKDPQSFRQTFESLLRVHLPLIHLSDPNMPNSTVLYLQPISARRSPTHHIPSPSESPFPPPHPRGCKSSSHTTAETLGNWRVLHP
jgi:hypothetical protein